MAFSGATLFEYMLRSQQLKAQQDREDQQRTQERQLGMVDRALTAQKQDDTSANDEFERKTRLAQGLGKAAGENGNPEPAIENPVVAEYATAGYGEGQEARRVQDTNLGIKRMLEAGRTQRFGTQDETKRRFQDIYSDVQNGKAEDSDQRMTETERHNRAMENIGLNREQRLTEKRSVLDQKLKDSLRAAEVSMTSFSHLAASVPSAENKAKLEDLSKRYNKLAQYGTYLKMGADPDKVMELLQAEGLIGNEQPGAPPGGQDPAVHDIIKGMKR